jgi:hypothetical protein
MNVSSKYSGMIPNNPISVLREGGNVVIENHSYFAVDIVVLQREKCRLEPQKKLTVELPKPED